MHALTLPFIDTDRMTPTRPDGTGLSARAWFAIGFAVFVGLWLFARLNDYWR